MNNLKQTIKEAGLVKIKVEKELEMGKNICTQKGISLGSFKRHLSEQNLMQIS